MENTYEMKGYSNYYKNGFIYSISSYGRHICIYDIKGNLINDTDLHDSQTLDSIYFSDEGTIFLKTSDYYYILSDDLQTETETPKPQITVEHGFKRIYQNMILLPVIKISCMCMRDITQNHTFIVWTRII